MADLLGSLTSQRTAIAALLGVLSHSSNGGPCRHVWVCVSLAYQPFLFTLLYLYSSLCMPSRLCIFVLLASFALPLASLWRPLFMILTHRFSLCVCNRERTRERESITERTTERERVRMPGLGLAFVRVGNDKAESTKTCWSKAKTVCRAHSALAVQGCQAKTQLMRLYFHRENNIKLLYYVLNNDCPCLKHLSLYFFYFVSSIFCVLFMVFNLQLCCLATLSGYHTVAAYCIGRAKSTRRSLPASSEGCGLVQYAAWLRLRLSLSLRLRLCSQIEARPLSGNQLKISLKRKLKCSQYLH